MKEETKGNPAVAEDVRWQETEITAANVSLDKVKLRLSEIGMQEVDYFDWLGPQRYTPVAKFAYNEVADVIVVRHPADRYKEILRIIAGY